jgi:hypothetical protein
MTQPEYVPVRADDEVRAAERLPVPHSWRADRPGDLHTPEAPSGPILGHPGPDQGYALRLVHRFDDRLALAEAEHKQDAVAGCLAIALRRAALFGRAPVIHDLELAFRLWGYLGDAPEDLVNLRVPLFAGASHQYWDQRMIADRVPDSTLRMTPAEVARRLPTDWRQLIGE